MVRVQVPLRIRQQRGRTIIEGSAISAPRSDATLIGALRKAHSMITLDTRHLPVCDTSPDTLYERRLIRLAFLAPDLQAAILDGRHPAHINLAYLIDNPVPLSWTEQRTMFAR